MKIEIKNWHTGSVLFEGEYATMRDAVLAAVSARTDLSGAYLSGAYLSGAYLSGAYLDRAYALNTILPEGDLIGYKKLHNGVVAKLSIPAAAKRVGGLAGRKCRAEYVVVLEGEGSSSYDHGRTKYAPGLMVKPAEAFDPCQTDECRSGIHFFITRLEAEEYYP